MKCRCCGGSSFAGFLDLGTAPPSNSYLSGEDLARPETWFPLELFVCTECLLVQVDEVERHDRLFSADYAYYSSFSRTWLEHASRYVGDAVARFGLGPGSYVVELASNDGYLLQYVHARGIPCLGIEPTLGTAEAAMARGIPTLVEFFGRGLAHRLAESGPRPDLMVANNVLAHVPDLHDFIDGVSTLLGDEGVVSFEFPHLLNMVRQRQFDTVYHEHFSYLSLLVVERLLAGHGLRVFDVETIPTHGGSLRVWACHDRSRWTGTNRLDEARAAEAKEGMHRLPWYQGFQKTSERVKDGFLAFLLEQKRLGHAVVGYGAAAKGNTLLNFSGIRSDLVRYVADASPHKQGRYLPGSRIPIVDERRIREDRPEFVVIFPWNLRDEIGTQLSYVADWGGKLVVAVPELEIFSP